MSVRNDSSAGHSVRWAVEAFLRGDTAEELRPLRQWYLEREQGRARENSVRAVRNLHERALFHLLEKGLAGESIGTQLQELEKEMIEICEDDIERFASSLPISLMAVLAVFAFPAMMFVLIGPLAQELLRLNN